MVWYKLLLPPPKCQHRSDSERERSALNVKAWTKMENVFFEIYYVSMCLTNCISI